MDMEAFNHPTRVLTVYIACLAVLPCLVQCYCVSAMENDLPLTEK